MVVLLPDGYKLQKERSYNQYVRQIQQCLQHILFLREREIHCQTTLRIRLRICVNNTGKQCFVTGEYQTVHVNFKFAKANGDRMIDRTCGQVDLS